MGSWVSGSPSTMANGISAWPTPITSTAGPPRSSARPPIRRPQEPRRSLRSSVLEPHGLTHIVHGLARGVPGTLPALCQDDVHGVGLALYSAIFSRIGLSSLSTASMTGCLHSRQPMPALRQPCCTQDWVLSSEYMRWNCHTGHFSGSPGSVRRTRAGSVCMVRSFFSTDSGASAARWCCHRTSTSSGRRARARAASASAAPPAPPGWCGPPPRDNRAAARGRPASGADGSPPAPGPTPAPTRRRAPGSSCGTRGTGGSACRRGADGALGALLEIRLAAVQVVEAPGDLAGDLHVRHLVLADRHVPAR
jgi:hypothetical protein